MSRLATTQHTSSGGVTDLFRRFARESSRLMGSPWAFVAAFCIIILWALSGPVFAFSDTWQLVINTGTTIVTFLMVFLIQNSQNHESRAIQLKLDELIRGIEGTHDTLIDLESLSEEELDHLQKRFEQLRIASENGAASGTTRDAHHGRPGGRRS
jgi:low affinity Fe/Cu permease